MTHSKDSPQLRLIEGYLRAVEAQVADTELARFFTADVKQRELPNRLFERGVERGLTELLAGSRKGREVVRNQRYELKSALVDGDRVAAEIEWSAELKVPLASTPAGGTLRAHLGVFFRIEAGRIAEQHNYDCYEPF
jgi:hypothetical protein